MTTREYPNDPEDVPRDPPLRPVITPPTGAMLVSAAQAIAHLRLATPLATDAQSDLTAKQQQASDAIRDYLKSGNDPTWDEAATNVPSIVQAATLLYLGNLWEHRGDDGGGATDADAACWMTIERLLKRQRDPAVA